MNGCVHVGCDSGLEPSERSHNHRTVYKLEWFEKLTHKQESACTDHNNWAHDREHRNKTESGAETTVVSHLGKPKNWSCCRQAHLSTSTPQRATPKCVAGTKIFREENRVRGW